MIRCRYESGRRCIDGPGWCDAAVLAGSRQDRAAHGVPGGSGLILTLAEGPSNEAVAGRFGTRAATVSKWRDRFAHKGLSGLSDAPRSGKPRHYAAEDERRVLAALDRPPPTGYARWDGTLLAQKLGDISKHQIWRVLRRHEISLARRRSWCISTDPDFAQKAADVVGLYLKPPEKAVVLSVDEKPYIQALERAQGWLKLPNGKAVNGFSHCYKRHGTTTLFARSRRGHRPSQDRPLSAAPAPRVSGLHEPRHCRASPAARSM